MSSDQPLPSQATKPTRVPDAHELRRRIPQNHPRILFRQGDFERLRERLDEPPFREIFQVIKEQADAGLGKPLPKIELPPDYYAPDLESWMARSGRSAEGIKASFALTDTVGRICSLALISPLVYRLTRDVRYREQARQAMRALAELGLEATSYTNSHAFHGVIPALAVGLDYLWDELETGERDQIVKALAARAGEFHSLSVQEALLGNPLDNHAITYGPPGMIQVALALYHHQPEAEEWLRDILTYLDQVFPTWGGDDGGWGQGFGYNHSHYFQFLASRVLIATGINFFNKP